MSIRIKHRRERIFEIIDSIRILPGALGKPSPVRRTYAATGLVLDCPKARAY
jgi:hypothetical protein